MMTKNEALTAAAALMTTETEALVDESLVSALAAGLPCAIVRVSSAQAGAVMLTYTAAGWTCAKYSNKAAETYDVFVRFDLGGVA